MISVCVPYWDRQRMLNRMFINYRQVYGGAVAGHQLEFSICDDGTPEPAVVPPGTMLTRLRTKHGPLNPCVPINRAVAASSGEILVITNAEVQHREPTLLRMFELLEGPDDYVMASCYDSRGFWLAGGDTDYTTRGRLPVPPGGHFHFCTMLYRTLWEKASGFDEDYRNVQAADDNDWLWRLHRAGAQFRLSASTVLHERSDGKLDWGIPHGRRLFLAKWPNVS